MKTLIIALALLCAFPVFAKGKKKVIYRKTQQVSFDEANIDGEVRSPDGSYVHQKRGVKFLPLYKVKKTFDKNIERSIEFLR